MTIHVSKSAEMQPPETHCGIMINEMQFPDGWVSPSHVSLPTLRGPVCRWCEEIMDIKNARKPRSTE